MLEKKYEMADLTGLEQNDIVEKLGGFEGVLRFINDNRTTIIASKSKLAANLNCLEKKISGMDTTGLVGLFALLPTNFGDTPTDHKKSRERYRRMCPKYK